MSRLFLFGIKSYSFAFIINITTKSDRWDNLVIYTFFAVIAFVLHLVPFTNQDRYVISPLIYHLNYIRL